MEKSSFGKKIDILMAEKNISMSELSIKIGKIPQTINVIQRSQKPRPKTIHAFAKALDVPVTYFFE